jgi:hypothetical protein
MKCGSQMALAVETPAAGPVLPPGPPEVMPDLGSYEWIVVSVSAGKDSQAMLDFIDECLRSRPELRARVVVVHADLGDAEWPGTRELARDLLCTIAWRDQ